MGEHENNAQNPEQELLKRMLALETCFSKATENFLRLLGRGNELIGAGINPLSPEYRNTVGLEMDRVRDQMFKAEELLKAEAISMLETLLTTGEKQRVPTGTYQTKITFLCQSGDTKIVETPTFKISSGQTLADLIKKSLSLIANINLHSQGLFLGELGLAQVEIQAQSVDEDSQIFKSPVWHLWLDIDGEPLSKTNPCGLNKYQTKDREKNLPVN